MTRSSVRWQTVCRLRRARPRSRFVRASCLFLLLLAVVPWFSAELRLTEFDASRRLQNLQRFSRMALPEPLRDASSPQTLWTWFSSLMNSPGWSAALVTLWISVAAIVLASALTAGLILPASLTLTRTDPFGSRPPSLRDAPWVVIRFTARSVIAVARSIPDYVLAFLAISLFGLSALPAVLALGLHNAGILARLGSEIVDNQASGIPAATRAAGHSRSQILLFTLFPLALPRFLVFFFYRWETCIRDATVVGTLGITSLGFWIQDARARDNYDQMLFFVVLSSILVLAGDLFSALVRSHLCRTL
ncbi:MAG TPA: ABC transporter permease subunit [Verrucomicrobiales bacterium]|nr:ABC transporter permease subunit [Verrucomicrobiales bacterium]